MSVQRCRTPAKSSEDRQWKGDGSRRSSHDAECALLLMYASVASVCNQNLAPNSVKKISRQYLVRLYRNTNSRFHVVSDFRRVKLPASRKSLSGDTPRYARTKARCQVLSSFTCSYSSLLVIPSARSDAGSRYEVIWVSDSDGKERRRELPLPCWVRRDCAFIV